MSAIEFDRRSVYICTCLIVHYFASHHLKREQDYFIEIKMPAVAKKTTKTLKAKNEEKIPKKSSIKKLQKTAELNAAKKLTKLESKKAVSQKVSIQHAFFNAIE